MNIEDPWQILADSRLFLDAKNERIDNSKFSNDELKIINQNLDEIKKLIYSLQKSTHEEKGVIQAQFEEMKKASQRIGRKDWVLYFLGNITTLLMNKFITPENINVIFRFIETTLRWIWNLPLSNLLPS